MINLHLIRSSLAALATALVIVLPLMTGCRGAAGDDSPVKSKANDDQKEASQARLADLLDRIDQPPVLKESTLDTRGTNGVLEDAFVKMLAKVEKYVEISIELKNVVTSRHPDRVGGGLATG